MNDALVKLEIENLDDVVVARVTGELDVAAASQTGDRIAEAVPTSARGLVVDMADLEFIDSSGVAMLFGLARRLNTRRQELRVVAVDGAPVARVLEIVEFDRAAPIFQDVQSAIADIA